MPPVKRDSGAFALQRLDADEELRRTDRSAVLRRAVFIATGYAD